MEVCANDDDVESLTQEIKPTSNLSEDDCSVFLVNLRHFKDEPAQLVTVVREFNFKKDPLKKYICPTVPNVPFDDEAQVILQYYRTINYLAYKTSGNEDLIFKCISISLYGNESFCFRIKFYCLLTIVENYESLKTNPILKVVFQSFFSKNVKDDQFFTFIAQTLGIQIHLIIPPVKGLCSKDSLEQKHIFGDGAREIRLLQLNKENEVHHYCPLFYDGDEVDSYESSGSGLCVNGNRALSQKINFNCPPVPIKPVPQEKLNIELANTFHLNNIDCELKKQLRKKEKVYQLGVTIPNSQASKKFTFKDAVKILDENRSNSAHYALSETIFYRGHQYYEKRDDTKGSCRWKVVKTLFLPSDTHKFLIQRCFQSDCKGNYKKIILTSDTNHMVQYFGQKPHVCICNSIAKQLPVNVQHWVENSKFAQKDVNDLMESILVAHRHNCLHACVSLNKFNKIPDLIMYKESMLYKLITQVANSGRAIMIYISPHETSSMYSSIAFRFIDSSMSMKNDSSRPVYFVGAVMLTTEDGKSSFTRFVQHMYQKLNACFQKLLSLKYVKSTFQQFQERLTFCCPIAYNDLTVSIQNTFKLSNLMFRLKDACDKLKCVHKDVPNYHKLFDLAKCNNKTEFDAVLGQLKAEFKGMLNNDQFQTHSQFVANFMCKPMWKIRLDSKQKQFFEGGEFFVDDVAFKDVKSEPTVIEQWVNVLHTQDVNVNLCVSKKGVYKQVDSDEAMEVSDEPILIEDD